MKELESKIQRRCQEVFKRDKYFVMKTHGDLYSRAGIPDLIACVPVKIEVIRKMLEDGWFRDNKIGIFIGLEVKTPETIRIFDDTREAQEIVGKEIKNSGGLWFVVDDDVTVEALLKVTKGEL